jgi:predicted ATPase
MLFYGEDPGVVSLSFASLALMLLGYPEQAVKKSHEARILAQKLAHPYSLAFALSYTGFLYQLREEGQAAQEWAEAALTLSTEQGFAQSWMAWLMIRRGWALAVQGQEEEGIAQMRQGLVAHLGTGAELWQPYYLARLAEAYGKAGQAEEGLAALAEAFAVVDKNGERFYEAELYRLKGELTLQSQGNSHESKVEKAQECFLKAIEIARKQHAKSLELRAVMNLTRLWQQQGKRAEAHRLLSEIYGWFTEGFDTKDLQEAKALLDELAGAY